MYGKHSHPHLTGMNRLLILFCLFILIGATFFVISSFPKRQLKATNLRNPETKRKVAETPDYFLRLQSKVSKAKTFVQRSGFSTHYAFFIDMSLPSGKKRFFVYDLEADTILRSGLVAHGSCRSRFLEEAVFSNVPECGCSSVGKYKIGYAYEGQFGTAFKLHIG